MVLSEKYIFLQNAYAEIYNTYFWIYNENWDLIHSNSPFENEFKNFFTLSMNQIDSSPVFDEEFDYFYFMDNFNLSWVIVREVDSNEMFFHVIGPALISSISDNTIREHLSANGMSLSSQSKLRDMLKEIQVVPLATLIKIAETLYFLIYNKRPTKVGNLSSTELPDSIDKEGNDPVSAQTSYLYEQRILNAVRNGDLTASLQTNELYYMGTLAADNPSRQIKDHIIVLTALVVRASIEGGLHPYTAYELSNKYIQAIESCTSVNQLFQIAEELFIDFIQRVHDKKNGQKYSSYVNDALLLLKQNYLMDSPMEDIAARLGYSVYYLTSQIKKETGKGYKEIIKNEKIAEAKLLLKNTTKDISEISEDLNFISPSYFTSTFRKETGVTPSVWRKGEQASD